MSQIGFVGLGKMGGNMVHRIRRDSDHEVVAFDFDKRAVKQAVKHGASGADSLKALVKQLRAPRMVWIMVPAGDPTQQTVDKLAKLLEPGDTIVDGGNSKWTDDKRRAKELKSHGIEYVDVRELPREGTPAPAQLLAFPYFAWSNRGDGGMRVWLPKSE